MKDYKKQLELITNKYFRVLLSVFIAFLFFFLTNTSLAESLLRGSAWWGEDLEYLYFSCNDYEAGSRLDAPGNFADMPPPPSFKFYIGGCSYFHGVTIDNNGILGGQAYNFKKGFVNFGGASTPVVPPNYIFASNCPGICNATNNCSACYNSNTQRLYGYAQVVGSQELIRLDSYESPESNLQLKSWDEEKQTSPFYNVGPGDFVGHASSTVKIDSVTKRVPLSFNCLSENGSMGSGVCASRDYKVYIGNPEIGRMTSPNWSFEEACSPGKAKSAVLRWYLKGGSYIGYEVAVTKNDELNTDTLSPNVACYSGIKSSSASQYSIPNSNDLKCKSYSDLGYNFSYYWFVRLHYLADGVPTATEWYQFGGDTNRQDLNNGPLNTFKPSDNSKTFTTYKHEFPVPYFTWNPEEILVNATTTIFNALSPSRKSSYYLSSSPSYPLDCSDGPCRYLWSVNPLSAEIANSSNSTTTIIFREPVESTVSLTVTDMDNYTCTAKKTVGKINYELPVWREVKAE